MKYKALLFIINTKMIFYCYTYKTIYTESHTYIHIYILYICSLATEYNSVALIFSFIRPSLFSKSMDQMPHW